LLHRLLADDETWRVSVQPGGISLYRVRVGPNGPLPDPALEGTVDWDDGILFLRYVVEKFLALHPQMAPHFDYSVPGELPKVRAAGVRAMLHWYFDVGDAPSEFRAEQKRELRRIIKAYEARRGVRS
jgi:hypothetical protein